MGIYRQTLPTIKFSGPTYFAPVLERFMQHVKNMSQNPIYHVLLILTDGVIHDMERSKQILVDLSFMPCSVIIIGLGDEDFEDMEELDGDHVKL